MAWNQVVARKVQEHLLDKVQAGADLVRFGDEKRPIWGVLGGVEDRGFGWFALDLVQQD
jgi:hypothetical protein